MSKSILSPLAVTLAVTVVLMTAAARADIVADSMADFSGTQGLKNWYYGSYSHDVGSLPGDFAQCPDYTYMWIDSTRTNLGVTSYGGRPSSAGAFWDAVHRWQVPADGVYQLAGVTKHEDNVASPTGTICYVYHWDADGAAEIWSRAVPAGDPETAYQTVTFTAKAGDYIDLAINSNGNSSYDLTKFTGQISVVPEPASLCMLIGGGLACLLRRKLRQI